MSNDCLDLSSFKFPGILQSTLETITVLHEQTRLNHEYSMYNLEQSVVICVCLQRFSHISRNTSKYAKNHCNIVRAKYITLSHQRYVYNNLLLSSKVWDYRECFKCSWKFLEPRYKKITTRFRQQLFPKFSTSTRAKPPKFLPCNCLSFGARVLFTKESSTSSNRRWQLPAIERGITNHRSAVSCESPCATHVKPFFSGFRRAKLLFSFFFFRSCSRLRNQEDKFLASFLQTVACIYIYVYMRINFEIRLINPDEETREELLSWGSSVSFFPLYIGERAKGEEAGSVSMCSDQEIGARRSHAGSKVLWFDREQREDPDRVSTPSRVPYGSNPDHLRRWSLNRIGSDRIGGTVLFVLTSSWRHLEDLDDGNMRTVEDRALDRCSSEPVDHKWRKSWTNIFLFFHFWIFTLCSWIRSP